MYRQFWRNFLRNLLESCFQIRVPAIAIHGVSQGDTKPVIVVNVKEAHFDEIQVVAKSDLWILVIKISGLRPAMLQEGLKTAHQPFDVSIEHLDYVRGR